MVIKKQGLKFGNIFSLFLPLPVSSLCLKSIQLYSQKLDQNKKKIRSYCSYIDLHKCVYILDKRVIIFVYSIDRKRMNIINSVALICNTNEVMSGIQRLLRAN